VNLRGVPLGIDVDGTLLDTWPRQLELLDACTRSAGLGPLNFTAIRSRKREGASNRDALCELLGPGVELESVCKDWLENVESDNWLERDRVLPGVVEALELLHAAGASPFLLSARQRAEALERQLKNLGLRHYACSVHVVSPFNAVAEKAQVLRALRASAYVGDSTSDARACRDADIPFFAVSTGQHSERLLRTTAAAVVRHSLTEVVSDLQSIFA
jgi:phosphoglycolate phosphatase-like HAD superfamily hydrolase